jgi:hypothetical protein
MNDEALAHGRMSRQKEKKWLHLKHRDKGRTESLPQTENRMK